VYISRLNHIQINFVLSHYRGQAEETALLDTGATENFINYKTVARLRLGTQKLTIPRPVFNMDGTNNRHGTITHVCDLMVKQGNRKERQCFYVSNLGRDRFILGYPWFRAFTPDIDWTNAQLCGPKIKMEMLKLETFQKLKKYKDKLQACIATARIQCTPWSGVTPEMGGPVENKCTQYLPRSGVTPVETQEGLAEINRTHNAIEMAHKYATEHGKEEVTLPEEFKRHTLLFSDEEANKFPPSRGEGDHKIELMDTAPISFNCKVYPLSRKEQEAEDKFLDENLAKGYIVPSHSPYGFSTFSVPKNDSKETWYIIDYRPLNAVTHKDVTPLPNLAQCIQDLQGMEVFSKFDIRWGYNNIQIKEGDEWKGAFKTRCGLYEPKVMFFGMSNSPASFQRFMNGILEELYKHFERKGIHNIREIFKNYMDNCGIGTLLKDLALHIEIIHFLFNLLAKHGLHLKLSKSVFLQPQMDFLGVRISKEGVTIDPAKVAGLRDYPHDILNLRQARGFLGIAGYHRMFCKNFSIIAAPITKLTGKDVPFKWGPAQREAQDKIIMLITSSPVLVKPDPSRQFELEVDASQISTGAILYQRDPPTTCTNGTEKPGPRRPVGFHSQKFTTTEQNYPIYDREFLAIMRGLRCWTHLLKGTHIPVLVYTDHTNLRYYRDPRKIGPRVAGYIPEREQYNILLEYKPGATNRADALSRRPDYEGPNPDNDEVLVWPDQYFCKQHTSMVRSHPGDRWPGGEETHICVFDIDSIHDNWDSKVKTGQYPHQSELKQWAPLHNLTLLDGTHWHHGTALVVVADNKLRRGVISLFHDHVTAGHPGITKTLQLLSQYYWWPNMKTFVTEYIKGCATCQMTKVNTHPAHPPLFPIFPTENARPFETVAMDFITKLPQSGGYNTILTVTDTDCSKASIFIPCNEAIDSEGVALLYLNHITPHYGIPRKIISDRDVRFTSKFAVELCRLLHIKQNMSTAYHPQTDGSSERTNQTLEQYLRVFCGTQQNNWHAWLPLAQYTKNSWPSATTKKTPFDLLIGYTPQIHQPTRSSNLPTFKQRLSAIKEARNAAQEAQRKAQESWIKERPWFTPFEVGTKVWLEGTNIRLPSNITTKLAPRRYGPFMVAAKISNVAYKLSLPPTWKIHDVFHASLLTPYKETDQHGPNFIEPPPDIIEGEEEWEVEQIIKERTYGQWKKKQYLVRWKGYSPAHDSWVNAEELHAPELLADFQVTQSIKTLLLDDTSPSCPANQSSTTANPSPPSTSSVPSSETHLSTPTPTNSTNLYQTQDHETRRQDYRSLILGFTPHLNTPWSTPTSVETTAAPTTAECPSPHAYSRPAQSTMSSNLATSLYSPMFTNLVIPYPTAPPSSEQEQASPPLSTPTASSNATSSTSEPSHPPAITGNLPQTPLSPTPTHLNISVARSPGIPLTTMPSPLEIAEALMELRYPDEDPLPTPQLLKRAASPSPLIPRKRAHVSYPYCLKCHDETPDHLKEDCPLWVFCRRCYSPLHAHKDCPTCCKRYSRPPVSATNP